MNKVFNFAKSVLNHASNGFPTVSEEVHQKRMSICKSCENFNKKNTTCNICGCFLEIKTHWALEQCPAFKWGPVNPYENTNPVTYNNVQNFHQEIDINENDNKIQKDCGCNKNV
jgi:hypothetical protein